MNILLITGGWSSEREISLLGSKKIINALEKMGHNVTICDLLYNFNNLIEMASASDFAFINMHGSPGEDGLVQALLEYAHCPYIGADPVSSLLCLNKAASKQIFKHFGIPTPEWEYIPKLPSETWNTKFNYPVFVKPNLGGSSLCMGRACSKSELHDLLKNIFSNNDTAIVEPEIKGQELTCAQLGNKILPPVLIRPINRPYFDYVSKYNNQYAEEICPAPISEYYIKAIQKITEQVCTALKLRGYGRCDFILSETGKIYVLEVNTLPGMTPNSLVPKEAKATGLDFYSLLSELINLSIKNFKS